MCEMTKNCTIEPDYSSIQVDSAAAYQEVSCSGCEKEWTEIYNFAEYYDENGDEISPVKE